MLNFMQEFFVTFTKYYPCGNVNVYNIFPSICTVCTMLVSVIYFSHRQQTWLQEALMCLRLTWSSKVRMYFTFVNFASAYSIVKSNNSLLWSSVFVASAL